MSAIRSGATVVLASIACVGLLYLSASGEGPVTQPSTRPAEQPGYVVKKGALSFEIEAEGTIQAADPVEVRLRPKVYSGPFTITAAAPHGAMVKKGDVLLELDTTEIRWALENAESALATAEANLKKSMADAELAAKTDAFNLRVQEQGLKDAEAAVKWWETVDGPQMLTMIDLGLKQHRDAVEDQQDEVNELKKMYKTEDITRATADIVIKRNLRALDQAKLRLGMQEQRNEKSKTFDYPIVARRVTDALEQAKQALASLKLTQEQALVVRKGGLTATRIAYEQAQQRMMNLKNDLAGMSVKAPADGLVLYGNVSGGAWTGSDPKSLAVGENIAAGQVVMRLVTPGKLKVDVNLPEMQGLWVERGSRAVVTPVAFPQKSYDVACPSAAQPRGGAAGVSFYESLTLPEADPQLLPGMKATVKISAKRLQDVLVVPLNAINDGTVQVKKNGQIEKRQVTVGRSDGKQVEIRSGLSEGEEVLSPAKK